MMVSTLKSKAVRFYRDEGGVALVEFAIFLPIFVLSFFVIVEFSRVFFSYQGAMTGVRDAARYMARVYPAEVCAGAADGSSVVTNVVTNPADTNSDIAFQIIKRNMHNENNAFPSLVRVVSVSTSYRCVTPATEGTFRQAEVPIARVFAVVEITLPLGGILELNGLPLLPKITGRIADESRIYGV
jgi:Flp pilus assembly protein TadG